MKTLDNVKKIISNHKNILNNKYAVTDINIFGSYSRNEQKQSSDLDVFVKFAQPVSLLTIISLENYLSDVLNIKVDVVPEKNIRKELKPQILKEAIPL
jgi:uncharacterized protein